MPTADSTGNVNASSSIEYALLRSAVAMNNCKTCKGMMEIIDMLTNGLEEARNREIERIAELDRTNPSDK